MVLGGIGIWQWERCGFDALKGERVPHQVCQGFHHAAHLPPAPANRAQQQALTERYKELSELTRITLEKSDRGEELETYPSVDAFFLSIEAEE